MIVQVTVETTGTMLLGCEIGAALTALEPLGIDLIGLNCATGPAEMSEHLRYLSQHARIAAVGDAERRPAAARPATARCYPLTPDELADGAAPVRHASSASAWSAAAAAPPRSTCARSSRRSARSTPARRRPRPEPGVVLALPAGAVPAGHRVLMIGERTNANGSKAFREAMLAGELGRLRRDRPRRRPATARTCSTSASTTSAATAPPTWREMAGRLATASTLPLMLDSTEPPVIEAGLELLGGRVVINSVNYEDGDGPESRFAADRCRSSASTAPRWSR